MSRDFRRSVEERSFLYPLIAQRRPMTPDGSFFCALECVKRCRPLAKPRLRDLSETLILRTGLLVVD